MTLASAPHHRHDTMAPELLERLISETLERVRTMRRLPESTYRLQFHAAFKFRDTTAIVPYLAELGVTHLYASPYLKARPGSTHGYDVLDHCTLNPELGTQADFDALLDALEKHGMTHVLDTVPNHVGVATNENVWWNDVLKNGPGSAYANFFDISWYGSPRPELHGKVLLPILGEPYGKTLAAGQIRTVHENGEFKIAYFDRRVPISPASLQQLGDVSDPSSVEQALKRINGDGAGGPSRFDQLHELLSQQHYRLSNWKTASDEINYRRFFDINDLAALAMEHEQVFEATHEKLILPLAAEGKIAGLRIDHPDGLYDPAEYFERLQGRFLLAVARRIAADDSRFKSLAWEDVKDEVYRRLTTLKGNDKPLYVVAEKILAADEQLPEDWAVHGTSGYDFLNMVNGLFIDDRSEQAFTEAYDSFVGRPMDFEELVYEKKRLMLDTSLSSELTMLAHRLDRLAQRDRESQDFTLRGLRDALRDVIACFPVYRSYITEKGASQTDQERIETAIEAAIRRAGSTDRSIFDFIRDTLLLRFGERFGENDRADQRAFAGKFQQLTAPVTAKGIEDTAFYIYNRFLSLNEVGGEPSRFGISAEKLHEYFRDRAARWPYAMSALSTHDTKRSEDVRARLNVLSEIPQDWRDSVSRWRALNAKHRARVGDHEVPGPNEEYAIYQTLVGAWPTSSEHWDVFVERINAFALKAVREGKVYTSWNNPNAEYEKALKNFVIRILDRDRNANPFIAEIESFQTVTASFGLMNSLAQSLLKLTAPGVPDTYQGCEMLDLSLVDPDNRRPVDYAFRRNALSQLEAAATLPLDERAKLRVHVAALQARKRHPGLFTRGAYEPLEIVGDCAAHFFGFARIGETHAALVVVPRFVARLAWRDPRRLADRNIWENAIVKIPPSLQDVTWSSAFNSAGNRVFKPSGDGQFAVAAAFDSIPVVLLAGERRES